MLPLHSEPDDEDESGNYPQYILLPLKDPSRSLNLPLKNIIRVESITQHTCAFHFTHPKTGPGGELPSSYSIGWLEEELLGFPTLFRVHNQHIINISQILYFDRKREVELLNGHIVPISRDRYSAFKECLGRFCITRFTEKAEFTTQKATKPTKNEIALRRV